MEQLQTSAKMNMEKNKYLRIVIVFEGNGNLDILDNLTLWKIYKPWQILPPEEKNWNSGKHRDSPNSSFMVN